jgi:hypothetical protein
MRERISRRMFCSVSVSVLTTMPSDTGSVQAVEKPRMFSISTKQSRHAPTDVSLG